MKSLDNLHAFACFVAGAIDLHDGNHALAARSLQCFNNYASNGSLINNESPAPENANEVYDHDVCTKPYPASYQALDLKIKPRADESSISKLLRVCEQQAADKFHNPHLTLTKSFKSSGPKVNSSEQLTLFPEQLRTRLAQSTDERSIFESMSSNSPLQLMENNFAAGSGIEDHSLVSNAFLNSSAVMNKDNAFATRLKVIEQNHCRESPNQTNLSSLLTSFVTRKVQNQMSDLQDNSSGVYGSSNNKMTNDLLRNMAHVHPNYDIRNPLVNLNSVSNSSVQTPHQNNKAIGEQPVMDYNEFKKEEPTQSPVATANSADSLFVPKDVHDESKPVKYRFATQEEIESALGNYSMRLIK